MLLLLPDHWLTVVLANRTFDRMARSLVVHAMTVPRHVWHRAKPRRALQDEPEDIPEWMAHHQRLGIGRFYIFDNGSDPPLNASLTQHIASGLVKCGARGHKQLRPVCRT